MTLPPHPLTNFETQEYYQNEPRFNGVFSRDNLPNSIKKNGAYVINLDEYHDTETHWVALYANIVIRNGKIVWKHGPNQPFFSL